MNPDEITYYITDISDGLDVVVAEDATFFYDPERNFDPAHRLPFATIVTSDVYDQFSHLDRPSVFRLNIGVGKETFRSLFGSELVSAETDGGDAEYDFTTLDQLMPHPVYGSMFWLCVLNPSAATFERLRPLLAEAYERAASRPTRTRPVKP